MNRISICEAYFVFAMLWHGGQATAEYAVFGRLDRIGFKPRPGLGGPEDLDEEGKEVYDRLVSGERRCMSV